MPHDKLRVWQAMRFPRVSVACVIGFWALGPREPAALEGQLFTMLATHNCGFHGGSGGGGGSGGDAGLRTPEFLDHPGFCLGQYWDRLTALQNMVSSAFLPRRKKHFNCPQAGGAAAESRSGGHLGQRRERLSQERNPCLKTQIMATGWRRGS